MSFKWNDAIMNYIFDASSGSWLKSQAAYYYDGVEWQQFWSAQPETVTTLSATAQ